MSTGNDTSMIVSHVEHITHSLQNKAQASKKQWWENYLKQVITFYGVPMNGIRTSVNEWVNDLEHNESVLKQTAFTLLKQPIAEQKLAGVLVFQNHVDMSIDDLTVLQTLFRDNYIYDWNTTDWLCVRVLGPLITREGEGAVQVFQEWVNNSTNNNPLWQRRAALVAFVNITKDYSQQVLYIAGVLARDSERFAQTAIGWTLRNLSKTHASDVVQFLNKHKDMLSSECINMASAKLNDSHRRQVGITGKRKRR